MQPNAETSLLFVAGGTGGHISPAVAVAEECSDRGILCVLLVGESDIRFPILRGMNQKNIKIITYAAPRFPSTPVRRILYMPLFLYHFFRATHFVRVLTKKYSFASVTGFGGYVSAPALWYFRRRLPIYLCEQNSTMGMVNRFFSRYARLIFLSFPLSSTLAKASFLQGKTRLTGNPVRRYAGSIYHYSLDQLEALREELPELVSRKAVLFDPAAFDTPAENILVMGGSQGARYLIEWAFSFIKTNTDIRCIVLGGTGLESDLPYWREHYEALTGRQRRRLIVFPFLNALQPIYSSVEICVCRSGGSLFELIAWKIPFIMVPYPYAAENHQHTNAKFFSEAFHCPWIDESSGHAAITEAVHSFLGNGRLRTRIKTLFQEKRFDNAAESIAIELCRFM